MALSDSIYEAALDIEQAVNDYKDSPIEYGEECLQWVRDLADLSKRAAGLIQDGGARPSLPKINGDTFAGPQRS